MQDRFVPGPKNPEGHSNAPEFVVAKGIQVPKPREVQFVPGPKPKAARRRFGLFRKG